MSIASFLDTKKILWTHIANEGKTTIIQNKTGKWFSPTGNKNKAKGKKKGVPDILIFDINRDYCGFAIELKVGYNTTSEEQVYWLEQLKIIGWKTLVSNSLDEVIFEVENYLKQDKYFPPLPPSETKHNEQDFLPF